MKRAFQETISIPPKIKGMYIYLLKKTIKQCRADSDVKLVKKKLNDIVGG